MRRITISVDDDLADAFEALVRSKGYLNRSEAFRDLVRGALGSAELGADPQAPCVAAVTYVYAHHERRLSYRLQQLQHAHHHVAVAATHVHLGHDDCLATVLLRGPYAQVKAVADGMTSQTGVRHGSVHVVPLARRQVES